MKYQRIKGTRDLLPEESLTWQWFITRMRKILAQYGYHEIRTPIFEATEIFVRSIGETTDIVEKEMYTFKDKGDRNLTLRPEGTAPVMRAILEHNLKPPIRLYYYGPMYRQERPQKGRLREFFQIGIEYVGNSSPFADREVIAVGDRIVQDFKIGNSRLLINSIGCPDCRGPYYQKLNGFLKSNSGSLCSDCQRRVVKNPMRFFDCKEESCQELVQTAPKIIEHLCPECSDHHQKLKKYLEKSAIRYEESSGLARGLDYYTRTVFEFVVPGLGAQNTIIGGGRYDLLIEQFGGPSTPAVGFAMGIERMLLSIKDKIETPPPVFIAQIGGLYQEARTIQQDLHRMNKVTILGDPEMSLKKQLREADRLNACWAIMIAAEASAANAARRSPWSRWSAT
ncbi:MAG TPA: histidine--tRNA ligase, partial [bacterium (Candidatus Stahlbacteria)]|nr:histidine--tRNA ligase [Candidatus Stahlbacteria bacterium]